MFGTLTVFVLLGIVTTALASPDESSESERAESFLQAAIAGNIAGINAGTLAQERAAGPVQRFADQLVDGHETALERSTTSAMQLGVEVPGTATDAAIAEFEKLAAFYEREFEQKFVALIIESHMTSIDQYASFLDSAGEPSEVTEYASDTLAVLEAQLAEARSHCKDRCRTALAATGTAQDLP